MLFGTSAVYHRGHWSPRISGVLRRLDHTNIFLIIAGTYTPLSVLLLPADTARTLLIVVWTGALIGLLARVFWLGAPRWVYVPVYVALGWVAVWFFPSFYRVRRRWIVLLIAVGGLAYTLGAIVYGIKRPNPSPRWFGFHEMFHVLTVVGYGATTSPCRWRRTVVLSDATQATGTHRVAAVGQRRVLLPDPQQRRRRRCRRSGCCGSSSNSSPTTPSGADDERAADDPVPGLPDADDGGVFSIARATASARQCIAFAARPPTRPGRRAPAHRRRPAGARTPGTAGRSRSSHRTVRPPTSSTSGGGVHRPGDQPVRLALAERVVQVDLAVDPTSSPGPSTATTRSPCCACPGRQGGPGEHGHALRLRALAEHRDERSVDRLRVLGPTPRGSKPDAYSGSTRRSALVRAAVAERVLDDSRLAAWSSLTCSCAMVTRTDGRCGGSGRAHRACPARLVVGVHVLGRDLDVGVDLRGPARPRRRRRGRGRRAARPTGRPRRRRAPAPWPAGRRCAAAWSATGTGTRPRSRART